MPLSSPTPPNGRILLFTFFFALFFSLGADLLAQPSQPAPTPPARESEDVVSIFSDSYTQVTGTNFNPNWQQSTAVTTEEIEENSILKYSNFNYQGIQIGSSQNVSGMDFLHLDLWVSDASAVSVFLISPGPEEKAYPLELVPNAWEGYDISLSEFSGVVDLTSVFQFKFTDGSAGDSPTIFLDNIYFFSGEASASTDATLKDLQINGVTIAGFSPSTFDYEIEIGETIQEIPTISANLSDENATFDITQASELPGSALIQILAEDGATELTYTVEFKVVTAEADASLSDLQINGATIEGFSPLLYHYVYNLDEGVTEVPTVSFLTSNEETTFEVIATTSLPGTTVIKTRSSDETRTKIYSVFFKTENLIWWDEFTNPDLNLKYWSYDIGDGCAEEVCGWGNQELQLYQQDKVYIDEIPDDNGNYAMVIEAEKNSNDQFISGRINSRNKVDIKYGILEIRMKVPDLEVGLWPAVWMLGSNNPEIGWPRSGEIDIMEMGQKSSFRTQQGHSNSTENQYTGSNVIWYSSGACNNENPTCAAAIAGDVNYNKPFVSNTDMNSRFQTYRLYWNQSQLRFTVEDEGTEYDLYTAPFGFGNAELQSTFRKPFYMIMNMAVGGNFTDALTAEQVTAPIPAKMYIDYIRLKDYNGAGEVTINEVATSSENDENAQIPTGFKLLQNYPNPFNPSSEITFELPEAADVRLHVFDVLGRQISTLVNEKLSSGLHTSRFNASNLSSGVYFYTLEINGVAIDTKKMILLK